MTKMGTILDNVSYLFTEQQHCRPFQIRSVWRLDIFDVGNMMEKDLERVENNDWKGGNPENRRFHKPNRAIQFV